MVISEFDVNNMYPRNDRGETRTEAADRIASEWLSCDYSSAKKLYGKLSKRNRELLEGALIAAALNGITEGERRGKK